MGGQKQTNRIDNATQKEFGINKPTKQTTRRFYTVKPLLNFSLCFCKQRMKDCRAKKRQKQLPVSPCWGTWVDTLQPIFVDQFVAKTPLRRKRRRREGRRGEGFRFVLLRLSSFWAAFVWKERFLPCNASHVRDSNQWRVAKFVIVAKGGRCPKCSAGPCSSSSAHFLF